jgi:hypothetical protein
MAGKCRSALGFYHGPQLSILTGEPLDNTPKAWRPRFWRCGTTGPAKYGDYVLTWWTWLHFIVNEVRMGYIESTTSLKWRDHERHSPAMKAELLAEAIRLYLGATYRYG